MIMYTASTVIDRMRSHCSAGPSSTGTPSRCRASAQLEASVCTRPFLILLMSMELLDRGPSLVLSRFRRQAGRYQVAEHRERALPRRTGHLRRA